MPKPSRAARRSGNPPKPRALRKPMASGIILTVRQNARCEGLVRDLSPLAVGGCMAQVNAAVAATAEPAIQMIGVNKWFGEFHVLRDINLTVDQGEKIVICGPSGSGKSTLIRCINRLEEHQKGKIIVEGVELTNDIRQVDKIRAEAGMVFQTLNLFP